MVRKLITRLLPLAAVTKLRELKHHFRNRRTNHSQIFTDIHNTNQWKSAGTLSGPGSELTETEDVRNFLPLLIERLGVKIFLDAPCGDFFWMQHVDLGSCKYIGADVVAELVSRNQTNFGSESRDFIVANLMRTPLPKADLILCRDCLIHMSFRDATTTIANFKRSGSKYLLVTTDTSVTANYPIATGEYHQINVELPPFSMGEPIELLRDRRNAARGEDLIDSSKALALYRLNRKS
jgi:hypothetical protein